HHFIVLDAIARGIKSIDKIARATRLSKEEVELVVNDLSLQRLILKEEKKRRFFGGNKLEIKVTETGQRMLNSKKQELQQQAEQLRQWNKNGDTAQLQRYMNSDNNRSWVPFMLFSGIMDILFFTSMMSMMGMALNPMESQMAADSGGGGAEGGAGETGTEADSSGAGFGDSDAGGDFGGFDGGGFGDF
ncbi:MAG TPA: MarR family transcriptional regulator, partial [Nitrososphaeraceae archaeon]|nr:MarR family transcriptional regulator [Nitrososphaeraceae archaeon]